MMANGRPGAAENCKAVLAMRYCRRRLNYQLGRASGEDERLSVQRSNISIHMLVVELPLDQTDAATAAPTVTLLELLISTICDAPMVRH
jgi:hypothetical protein